MPGQIISRVALADLRKDFQPAENFIPETVELLRLAIQSGEQMPPVTVYFDGATYWLYDGFHRVAAAEAEGLSGIEAEIVLGTWNDMQTAWQKGLAAIKQEMREWALSQKAVQEKET